MERLLNSCTEINTRINTFTKLDKKPAPLNGELQSLKRSYVTRHFNLNSAAVLDSNAQPSSGDLLVAKIVKLGQHRRLEGTDGRRQHLFTGDKILVCYGARYASDQFHGVVPETQGPCNLVAAGGIASAATIKHNNMKGATEIEPLGIVCDAFGNAFNLRSHQPKFEADYESIIPTTAIVGTAMNAGKTTTGAAIVRGLSNYGHRVGVAKITGTGAGGDRWHYLDSGAECVLDFTDFGYSSTYQTPTDEVTELGRRMCAVLAAKNVTHVVLEIADGLMFQETAALISAPTFNRMIDRIAVAAGDAMGAVACVEWLKKAGISTDILAGQFTSSPLAVQEVRAVSSIPIFSRAELETGDWYKQIIGQQDLITHQKLA